MCNVFSYTFINNVAIINNCDNANAAEMLLFKKICTQLLVIATFYDFMFFFYRYFKKISVHKIRVEVWGGFRYVAITNNCAE